MLRHSFLSSAHTHVSIARYLIFTKSEDTQARGEEAETKPNVSEEEKLSKVGPVGQEHADYSCNKGFIHCITSYTNNYFIDYTVVYYMACLLYLLVLNTMKNLSVLIAERQFRPS
jgi:hypothetical protein